MVVGGNCLKQDLRDFRDLQDCGTCDESHYYEQEGKVSAVGNCLNCDLTNCPHIFRLYYNKAY